MELSLIQKDILITLITLYHQKSAAIKGEGIAEVLKRNPGTVRNQMQALKVLGLVDGVPGPKGGYTPTSAAYKELNLTDYEREYSVPIQRNCERCEGVNVAEIDFTTLCHPDLCHAVIKLIGSVKGESPLQAESDRAPRRDRGQPTSPSASRVWDRSSG